MPRPSLHTALTVTTRHWSQWHRLMRGEVQWSVPGEAAVMPGGTGRGGGAENQLPGAYHLEHHGRMDL